MCRIYRDRAAARHRSSMPTSVNGHEHIRNAKALPLCPPPGSEHKSSVLAERGKEKALSRLSLASVLYLLHCVVKSSWQAVDSGGWGEGENEREVCPLLSLRAG